MATSNQVSKKKVPNPTGKGGFKDRPEDINKHGYWDSTMSISFQYKRFLKMTPAELQEYLQSPLDQRTVAMEIAYAQVRASARSLPHAKEVTDRTEGKAPQSLDITSLGERLPTVIVESVYAAIPKFRPTNDSHAEVTDMAADGGSESGTVQDTPVRQKNR